MLDTTAPSRAPVKDLHAGGQSALRRVASPLSDGRLSAPTGSPQAAAFRLRVLRRRRRRRRWHRAQLGRARCHRAGAALWRHHRAAAGRHRAVRPTLLGADRCGRHGRAVAGVSRRRPVSRRGCAARARALHARPGRRHDRRACRRDRARRAVVPALPLLAQRACHRLRSGQARRRPAACRRWCSRSTCRCAPRARARSPSASPRRSGQTCGCSPASPRRPAISPRSGGTASRASPTSSPIPPIRAT